jgi:hypothetical protein
LATREADRSATAEAAAAAETTVPEAEHADRELVGAAH